MAPEGGIQDRAATNAGSLSDAFATEAPPGRPRNPSRPRAGFPRRPIPPKLYRIGEIVDYTGVSRQTIHNYTTMGLITESRRTHGGHRLYDESVFARLDLIAELKQQNRSMRDIRGHFERMDTGRPERG